MTILTKLKQTAERATNGPWESENWETCVMQSGMGESTPICITTRNNPFDAAHIALNNPETTLKICDAFEVAIAALRFRGDIETIAHVKAILASIEKEGEK